MIKEKGRECMVHVTSRQINTEGEEQIIKTRSRGRLLERSSALLVLYEENMEQGQRAGEDETALFAKETVKNLLKIETEPFRASIKKSGAVSWEMTFEQGKRAETAYETPYGTFGIGAETETLVLKKEYKKTSLQLAYTLFIQGEKQADCRLEIEIL